MNKINKKYVPKSLTAVQKKKQIKSIVQKKDRPIFKTIKPRRSKYTLLADKYFKGDTSLQNISKKLNVNIAGLKEIIKKGQGAYYSSGSRPNQTAQSWSLARLYSVLFGGKARNVDESIVKKYKIPLLQL